MERQPWLEKLSEELAGQGLPAGVRLRLLVELQDHLDDLTEGGTNMITGNAIGLRMGVPAEVAARAGAEFRNVSWVRRHPRLVFLLAPIPLLLLGVAIYLTGASLVAYACSGLGYAPESLARPTRNGLATAFVHSIGFVPFLAVAWFFARVAIRSQVGIGWTLAAVGQVALLAGLATTNLSLSDEPGRSQFMVGLSFPFGWLQAAQLAMPLATAALMLVAASRRRAGIAT